MSNETEKVQRVFSWDTAERHIFEIVREPKSNNVSRDGYEWVCSATIAKFGADTWTLLMPISIGALKRDGWAWVEPGNG